MCKETITIKNEKALLEYLYKRLALGCTDPITENEYFRFINLFEQRVNNDNSLERISFEKESFVRIVAKAMEMLYKTGHDNTSNPLSYKEVNGVGTIHSTYELKPIEYSTYRMVEKPRQMAIARTLMTELTPKVELSTYDFIKFDSLEAAQKVASFYINDIINRYIQDMVRLGLWPSEFTDVDKYVFEQNFAQTFNGKGTKELFINAYIHATRIVSELKDSAANNETIMFSNNPNKPLAYANYLKMLSPEQLKFLIKYSHNPYALNDAAIDISTRSSDAYFNTEACTYYDENGDWSNRYERSNGIISRETVKVMQKRLRNITDYQ